MRTRERFTTATRPEIVWSIIADVERWPTWTPTVLEVKPLTHKGLVAGSRYLVTQPKLRPAVYEVVECIEGENFTWAHRIVGGAFLAEHRIVQLADRTEVELSFLSEGLLAHLFGAMWGKTIREYVATEAKSLKRACETL